MDNCYMQGRSTNENDAACGQSCRRVMSGPDGLIAHGQQTARASSHLLVAAGLGFTVLAVLQPRFATSLSLQTLLTSVRRHDIVYRRWCCVRDSPLLTMVSSQVAATGTEGTTRFAQVQATAPCTRLSNHGNRLAISGMRELRRGNTQSKRFVRFVSRYWASVSNCRSALLCDGSCVWPTPRHGHNRSHDHNSLASNTQHCVCRLWGQTAS
jgi:hypothetical protein